MNPPPDDTQAEPRKSEFRSEDLAPKHDPPGVSVKQASASMVEVKLDEDQLAPPNEGFGRLWRKVHRVSLDSVDQSPEQIVATWKEHFSEFWPGENHFYAPVTGIQPGEIAVMDLEMPGGGSLSTGIAVLYSKPDEFALMTPRGHMFAGWIAFSARRIDDRLTAQIEILMRSSDPLFEIGMELLGHRRENTFWEQTLHNLAAHFGLDRRAETQVHLIDSHRQWSHVTNVWHNSVIRSMINGVTGLFARLTGRTKESRTTNP